MGRGLDICGKVATGMVAFHVKPCLPQLARTDVDYPALVGYVHRLSIFTVECRQRFRVEFLHVILS